MEGSSFYVLFESASGYALFSVLEAEQIATLLEEVRVLEADFQYVWNIGVLTMPNCLYHEIRSSLAFLICPDFKG